MTTPKKLKADNLPSSRHYFFCGIGGRGMRAIVPVLLAYGHEVSGSDRAYDNGDLPEIFHSLKQMGVTLYPQDGSGVKNCDEVIVSSAVEDSIPDIKAAKKAAIPIKKRAELLAFLANSKRSVAVAGTSGKTTVTGMTGHILSTLGAYPTMINGGEDRRFDAGKGSAFIGTGPFVIEADESDGSIALYKPAVALINNISLDHKSLDELRTLFLDFAHEASEAVVINADCTECAKLIKKIKDKTIITYRLLPENKKKFAKTDTPTIFARDIELTPTGTNFTVEGYGHKIPATLRLLGKHNVQNALAALAACAALGMPLKEAVAALASFAGIRRRMELIGSEKGVIVFDDFGHNPDKIRASLQALKAHPGRLWAIFQPHGFGPMKMMRKELVKTFADNLDASDAVLMPPIYFAGGTVDKSISSADVVADLRQEKVRAYTFEHRNDIPTWLAAQVKAGDRVLVMGARDDTLTHFAKTILEAISKS